MKNKKKLFLGLALCLFLGTSKVSAATVKSYFPDEKLFTCLASTASINENTDESEFEFGSLDHLICNTGVSDATGIEKLTGLTILNLDGGQLTNIDLSKNTQLKTLSLVGNQLTSIDLSKNTALTYLTLSSNQLTTVDLSNNTALRNVNLINNKISSIDLSKNTALTVLNIARNQLTTIDLSKNTALTSLTINNNPLLKNVELTLGDEFSFSDYIIVNEPYGVEDNIVGDVLEIDMGKLVAKKVGSEVVTFVVKNYSTGAEEEFESTITVVEPKGEDNTEEKTENKTEETKEEAKTSDTTENPKTGIYGGSIALVVIAGGAYIFMKNKNKYNSVR